MSIYDQNFQKSGLSPSLQKIVDWVPEDALVLDIGCSSGYLAKVLKKKQSQVFGVEANFNSVKKAQKYCQKVIIGSIENPKTWLKLKNQFEVIILADVLEHLINPEKVLKTASKKLKKSGLILISIPNIAHWQIRLRLLVGKFNYTDSGLLDKTHLRFFTEETIRKLIDEAGFKILKFEYHFVFPFENRLLNQHIKKGLSNSLGKGWPRFFGYQFIIKAIKK